MLSNTLRRPTSGVFLCRLTVAILAACFAASAALGAVQIDHVFVGNPGNPADFTGHGAVQVSYHIGKYEVTNAQYAAFLNAVAATDTHGLFSPYMSITRTGTSGAYRYTAIQGNQPVRYVNWYDAARFANWLHNGQPNGAQNQASTEAGAYALSGSTPPTARSRGARAWLPSEDEWYKAAYYDPTRGLYWTYPTCSDKAPAGGGPGGGGNRANAGGTIGAPLPVGSYSDCGSPYGTFDQAGNVWEWTESPVRIGRGLRGGSFNSYALLLSAGYQDSQNLTLESEFIGFRVASIASDVLLAMADNYETVQDSPLTVNAPGVMSNDNLPQGGTPVVELWEKPANGSVTLNSDGSFVYEPAEGFVGIDAFLYLLRDGQDQSGPAAVTIDVKPLGGGTDSSSGALTVILSPDPAVAAGARWRVEGGEWLGSGDSIEAVAPGDCALEYSPVVGWTAPPKETVTITAGQPLELTRSYSPGECIIDNTDTGTAKSFKPLTGAWKRSTSREGYYGTDYVAAGTSVTETSRARWQCTTLPSGSYDVYVRWTADPYRATQVPYVLKNGSTELATVRKDQTKEGGKWILLGAYAFDAGQHAVEIHNGDTKRTNDFYVVADAVRFVYKGEAATGSLSVVLGPADAAAEWRVDGGAWQVSGAVETDLLAGTHQVEYRAGGAYAAPPTESVQIVADETLELTRTCSVACIVDNADTGSAKSFQIVSGSWSRSSGRTGYYGADYRAARTADAETHRARWQCTTLPAGSYEVYARWSSDTYRATQTPYVIKNGSTELATVRKDQTQNGGEWVLLGTYAFDAGKHTVDIHNGGTRKQNDLYIIADAVQFRYVGEAAYGSLNITLNPAASAAQWRVDGGAWQNSGATVSNLLAGTHQVEYKASGDYAAPDAESVTIAADETLELTRTCTLSCIVDNRDTTGGKLFQTLTGGWSASSGRAGYYGTDYLAARTSSTITRRARWKCTTLPTGTYKVYARWSADPYRSTRTPYVVKNGSTELATIRKDQTQNGGEWVLLGQYAFDEGQHVIEIHNGDTNRRNDLYVVADAVRFVYVGE